MRDVDLPGALEDARGRRSTKPARSHRATVDEGRGISPEIKTKISVRVAETVVADA